MIEGEGGSNKEESTETAVEYENEWAAKWWAKIAKPKMAKYFHLFKVQNFLKKNTIKRLN